MNTKIIDLINTVKLLRDCLIDLNNRDWEPDKEGFDFVIDRANKILREMKA
jgi:hypothetical protein